MDMPTLALTLIAALTTFASGAEARPLAAGVTGPARGCARRPARSAWDR